jgi:DNA-directed RNA polymerase specialized sigma24 family protein
MPIERHGHSAAPTPHVAQAVDPGGGGAPVFSAPRRPGISPRVLAAVLGQPAMQTRIRDVVARRVARGAPPDLVGELVQRTSLAVLEAKWTPRSTATARAWIAGVAVRTVALYFRRQGVERRWLDPDVDVDEQTAHAMAAPDDAPDSEWLVGDWLARAVADDARDEETFALLLYKGRTGKSHDEIAHDHGITVPALKNRIHDFKRKYEPRWRHRQSVFFVLWLGGGAAAVLVALLVAWLLHPRAAVERREVPPPVWTPVPVPPREAPFAPAQSAPVPTASSPSPRERPAPEDKPRAP